MIIDLRSDTVTRPTEPMRAAMAKAEVGDDVYGEDPTTSLLERTVADRLGFEAGLFVTSGTMGNQLALRMHTEPGDEVYAPVGAHVAWYESGAAGALSGVSIVELARADEPVGVAGNAVDFEPETLAAAIKPRAYYGPRARLLVLENTHNRGGGSVVPIEIKDRLLGTARAAELKTHLDGARLWNASVASGIPEDVLAKGFDSATVCFSKGLGAPVGSVLVASADNIERARRFRKMWGGGMRQSGVLAAACLYGLAHHRSRLALDHAAARELSQRIGAAAHPPQTNIVMIDLDVDANAVVLRAAEEGLRVSAFGPKRLRAVTHLDLAEDAIARAAEILRRAIDRATT